MPWSYWFDSVLTGRFKMGKPSEFNDPFDCIGSAEGDYSEKVVNAFVEANYTQDFGTTEAFRTSFLTTYKGHEDEGYAKRMYLDSLCRIMSMTDVEEVLPENELLMWSHYAGNAKGVRFLFDIPETDDKYWLEHVTYDSGIPCFHRSLADAYQNGEEFVRAYHAWIYTKSRAWQYEKEVRLVLHKPNWEPYYLESNDLSFFKMPREWVREITFGSEADLLTANVYMNLLREAGFGHIAFRVAVKKKYEYGLEYVALS